MLPPITPDVLDEHVRRYLAPNDADAVLNDPLWGPSRDVITETFHNDLVDIGDMLRVIRNQIPAGTIREAASPAAWLVGNLTSHA